MTRREGYVFDSHTFSLDQRVEKKARFPDSHVDRSHEGAPIIAAAALLRASPDSLSSPSFIDTMASVGALSARPALGQRVRASTSRVAVRRASVVRPRMGGYESGNAAGLEGITQEKYVPGINMPEGPKDALNKWSRKITQPKSQGASQVSATPDPTQPPDRIAPRRLTDKKQSALTLKRRIRRGRPEPTRVGLTSPFDPVSIPQAMLYATGLQPEDMNKPQVGVSSVW